MTQPVLVERRGPVVVLTLNLSEKRNTLSDELVQALGDVLCTLQTDGQTRALVLTGGANFCAGGDLHGMAASLLRMRQKMQVGHRIARSLIGGSLPAIAAVEGSAYGAGFSIALACDFVVADEHPSCCAGDDR